jgi:hypothetical protein
MDTLVPPRKGNNMENINKKTMERLAEAAHKVWMEGKLRDGWRYGPITDKDKKIHSCLVRYSQLSEADKESDRDMVRGIPSILAAAGYKMVKMEER